MVKSLRIIVSLLLTLILNEINAQNNCNTPVAVEQSVWRNGLDSPIGVRSSQATTNIVIHHSADVNTVMNDYTPVVQSIYNFHTKSNGWDDIGYNYLIAPDGVIFKGRDPQGLGQQDNVQGAHMCNKNENTMGICMLGTFSDQLPSRAALKSLYMLAAWKVNKDNIEVYGSTMHGIGPSSANLPNAFLANICGHRDGCSLNYTECPGNAFYNTFSAVKDSVSNYVTKCNLSNIEMLSSNQFKLLELNNKVFKIPVFNFKTIKIYNLVGQIVCHQNFDGEVSSLPLPLHEMLFVELSNEIGKHHLFRVYLD